MEIFYAILPPMNFNQLHEKPRTEKSPDLIEINKERAEKVIENAQKERLKLFNNVLERIVESIKEYADKIPKPAKDLLANVFDFTLAGLISMAMQAIRGKTLTGEEVSTKDRIGCSLVVISNITSYLLAVHGFSEKDTVEIALAGKIYLAHWGILVTHKTPQITKNIQQIEPLRKIFLASNEIRKKYYKKDEKQKDDI